MSGIITLLALVVVPVNAELLGCICSFKVLLSCWNLHPSDRPSFNQLRSHFAGLKLTHKHVPSLFSCAQTSDEDGHEDGDGGRASGGVAVFTDVNVYL